MNLQKAYKILEENKETFNKISGEFSHARQFIWSELKELERYIRSGEKVLDLGCGNGRMYELFKNKQVDYTGIDFSEGLIDIARKKYGNRFIVGDILSLPFSDQYFDSVWSIAVLHHIPLSKLRKRALSEVRRVLKQGGRIVTTCWKLKSFLRKDIFVPFQGEKRYYHVFTKREFEKLFADSGFKIEESRFLKRDNKKTNILIVAKKI